MVFMNKTDSLALAKELGIENAEELKWPDLQKAIAEAQADAEPTAVEEEQPEAVEVPSEDVSPKMQTAEAKPMAEDLKPKKPQRPEIFGKTVMLAPELRPERYRLVKYEEEVGYDKTVEEINYDISDDGHVFDTSGSSVEFQGDVAAGTYRVTGQGSRRVIAQSSVPKENFGLSMQVGVDYFPVVSWNGKKGYLWNHFRYPSVKQTLIKSGYYEEYKDRFVGTNNIWYAAGKMLAVNINLVHQVMREIEQKAQKAIQEDKAYRESLGL